MLSSALKRLLVFVLFFAAGSLYAQERMLPAPEDRLKYNYEREPGKLKLDKFGLIDPSPDVTSLEYLPKDKYGFVDWARAIDDEIISPRSSILEDVKEKPPEFNEDILLKSKMDFMPDVIFPHDVHNLWLKCSNCHTEMFEEKAGATPMTMTAIWKGEYCGRCHDKVAFPIRNCFKCHSVPRENKK